MTYVAPRNGAPHQPLRFFPTCALACPRARDLVSAVLCRLSGAVPDSVRCQRLLRRAPGSPWRALRPCCWAAAARCCCAAGASLSAQALAPCPPIVLLLSGFPMDSAAWNVLERSAARHGSRTPAFYLAVNLCVSGHVRHRVRSRAARTRAAPSSHSWPPASSPRYGEPLRHPVRVAAIVPADVFALSTAASVGAQATLLSTRLLAAVSVFAIASTAIMRPL